MPQQKLTLVIMDREYPVHYPSADARALLQQAADLVQQRMQDKRQKNKRLNNEAAAVMVALDAIYEQLWTQQEMCQRDQQVQRLLDKIDGAGILGAGEG